VRALFPTFDELVRGCGAHFFEGLGVPPEDRAPMVFAGAASDSERIRRLTETFFGTYERGAAGIAVARSERHEVPALDESVRVLESAFDALATEALPPNRRDPWSLASVRALTAVEVWQALRDSGATSSAAVEQGTAAVERWIAAHPAG